MKRYLIIFILPLLTACTATVGETQSTPSSMPTSTTVPTLPPSPAASPDVPATPMPEKEIVYKLLSNYTSPMTSKDKNRIYNIKLASEKINLYIIEAGEIMSFNDVVGDTDKKQGYKKAVIYVDGQKEKGYGGGVCQLSSTLYNAALGGNLEIVERHAHNGPEVKYVPKDKDATVAYGLKDLKIKNVFEKPIRVVSEINNDGVSIALEIQEN